MAEGYSPGEDVLAYAGVLTASWDSGTGTLWLTGTDSLGNYEAALRSVTYENLSEDPSTALRVIQWTVNDGLRDGSATSGISINSINDPPVVTAGATSTYTDNAPAIAVDSTLTVDDVDNQFLSQALVQITPGSYVAGEDVLDYTPVAGITAAVDNDNLLSFTVTNSLANYEDLLQGITYENTGGSNPTAGLRTIEIIVTDEDGVDSAVATATIDVQDENDPPVITVGDSQNYTEGDGKVAIDSTISITDADDTTLQAATVSFSSGFVSSEDVLNYDDALSPLNGTVYPSGALVLTGSESLGTYMSELAKVTYENTNTVNPTAGDRVIQFSVNDGDDDSNTDSATITVIGVNSAPEIEAGEVGVFTEGDVSMVVDNTIDITDLDHTTLQSAKVSITGNFQSGEDVLSYDGATDFDAASSAGELTLTYNGTGAATIDEWASALESVYYENDFTVPTEGIRTMSFVVNDGVDDSQASTATVEVMGINSAPVVSAGDTQNYIEGQGTVLVDGDLAITDVDDTHLEGATVEIGTGYQSSEDMLWYDDTVSTNITGIFYPSLGELIFTGTDTVGNYQAQLRTVTYENINDIDPDTSQREISFTVNDGQDDSAAATATISVIAVNDPPIVSSGQTLAYIENGGPVIVDPAIGIIDVDSLTLQAATISLGTTYIAGEDVLSYPGPLAFTWDTVSGVLTLSGSDTVANYESALASVTYENLSNAPNTATRTVDWSVNDGIDTSPSAASWITISPVNDPPIVSSGQTLAYTENGGPVAVDPAIGITDVDSLTLQAATISLGTTYIAGEDVLSYPGPLTFTWDTVSGVLTLSGSDTVANYESALASVTYENLSNAPNTATRTVDWSVNDGIDTSPSAASWITISPVNDPPIVSSGQTLAYIENGGPVAVDPAIGIIDVDSLTLQAATVSLGTTYIAGEDVLAYTGTLVSAYDSVNGVLTLSGSDTVANYQSALASITYDNLSNDPSTTHRSLTWKVSDGIDESNTTITSIFITSGNNPPVLTSGHTLSYIENDGAVPIDPSLAVSDIDSLSLHYATVSLGISYISGEDVLGYTGLLTPTWNTTSGILTLSGSDTVANYESALTSVTYENRSEAPTPTPRIVTWTVNDGTNTSNPVTTTIDVLSVNDPPLITSGATQLYTEGDGKVVIDDEIDIIDVDNIGLVKASIRIASGYSPGEDILNYDGTGLGTSWNSLTGMLLLSGTATTADFESALRNVTYENIDNASPTTGVRTIEFQVSDGITDSSPVTAGINVVGLNDPPVITGQASLSTDEESSLTVNLDDLMVNDPDTPYPSGFTLQLLSGANYTVSGATVTPAEDFNGTLTVPVTVNDGTDDSPPFNLNIAVLPVNDPPTVISQAALSVPQNASLTIELTDLTVVDPDNAYPGDFTLTVFSGANYTVSGNTVTPTTDFSGALSVPVIVNDGAIDSPSYFLTVDVTPANSPPTIHQGSSITVTMDEDGNPVPWTPPELTASDPEGDPLTWKISASPQNGSAEIDGTGTVPSTLSYSPFPDFNGADSFIAGVSDGNGGTATIAIDVIVHPVNDAPFLSAFHDPVMPPMDEDLPESDNMGVTVSEILSSSGGNAVYDPDSGALTGIAVVGSDDGNGQWQYDIGAGFVDFPAISETSALLLNEAASIRFLPNENYYGEMESAVSFRAWDQTRGSIGETVDTTFNGGTSAFKIASVPLQPGDTYDGSSIRHIQRRDIGVSVSD